MSIRTKLIFFVSSFLAVMLLLIIGSLFIFEHISSNFEELKNYTEEHNSQERLSREISSFIKTVEKWGLTGDKNLKKDYHERLSGVYTAFGDLEKSRLKESISAIGKDFEEIRRLSSEIMAAEKPLENVDVIFSLRRLKVKEEEINRKIEDIHSYYIKMIDSLTKRSERIKREVALYLALLFIFTSFAFLLLALFMRRMIEVPFNDILTATNRIISGDLDYRIASKRTDEFGVLAERFDLMVEELKKISEKNEELYISTRSQLEKLKILNEITKAITSTLNLDELLGRIAEEATRLLNAKGCVIRLLEDNQLIIRASYGLPREIEKMMTVSLGEGIPGKVAKEGRPILVEDLSKLADDWKIPYLEAKSVINVPLIVSNKVIGTLGLYDKMTDDGMVTSFSGEDLKTAEGFASLSAIAIDKAKAFEIQMEKEKEVAEAKKRLEVLFESVQSGIVTVGKDYRIISANRYVESWTGTRVEDIIGKNCIDVFHGKGGICPHCVAQVTCETGDINIITQSSGLNYAELSSYPIKDAEGNVTECVVLIQDITDRVLYQEEMLNLYKEVAQTKDYLESLIDNSADAIITTDINGIVTSWNKGAERIYGYTEEEAVGKFLPFVPDFLIDKEKENAEKVKNGEVLKDIETIRKRKDGTLFEVSLTLSPVKDVSGNVIGISGISRDISEKKRVEKELIRKNQELSRLFFISSAMRSTLDLNRLLRMILTAVTMGDGLGFNRAILFLIDEEKGILRGVMGVGPVDYEEAGRIWSSLSFEQKTLNDVMDEIDRGIIKMDSFLERLSLTLEIPLDRDCIMTRAIKEKIPFNVVDAKSGPLSDPLLIQQLGTEAYAVVPLLSRDKVIGILWVDNLFNKKPITEEDIKFLTAFSNHVATAVESAKLFEQVSLAEAELENIFRSITDMVYFTDMDYTIKSVNKAVENKLGLDKKEIIGKKCYEIFHGMKEPWPRCPHHKTVESKTSYVEELEDPYMGGTFLTSTSPIFDLSGNFLGTVHIVRDITELKYIRERLQSAERMAALGEVAAKVAHEIRNPLVSIGGFAQRLERKLDGNLKEYASIIYNEVKRLEDILKDILGFVREIRLSITDVNINDLVSNVIALVEGEIHERGLTLERYLSVDVPPVKLDYDRMKEAILNILNNAIQAVLIQGKIIVRTYRSNGFAVVEISDTGTGISEKDLPFIFDPFYTTKTSGTGLGLAITRRIVEEHNGRIEVKSKLGEGTTFKIFLPSGKEEI